MKPNKKLLRETLLYIEKHPRRWKQGTYRCRTGYCFAGHAAILAGTAFGVLDESSNTWTRARR